MTLSCIWSSGVCCACIAPVHAKITINPKTNLRMMPPSAVRLRLAFELIVKVNAPQETI
jgi:hypothetical protein